MFSTVLAKAAALPAMRFVLSLGQGLFKHSKADSLISFANSTRVEPIALIDSRAVHLPYIADIMQSVNSMFIGYYLQAVSLLVNVGSVNVIKLLDTLSPTRDVGAAGNAFIVSRVSRESCMLSLESYRHGLPVPQETASLEDNNKYDASVNSQLKNFQKADPIVDTVSGTAGMRNLRQQQHDTMTDAKGNLGSGSIVDPHKAVSEAVNLSVGKMIQVNIESEGKKASFPISVRLIATPIAADVLTHILGDGSRNTTAVERFHAWRSGQLEFIRDIVFAQDLIDEHRKALIKDPSGAYAEILKRRRGNNAAGVLSSTPSIGTASNLVILTSQTAKELEMSIGGRLSDVHTRKKVFDNTYVMIMVVVDTEYEQVTIYHRGIALPTKLSVKELKTANKGTGPDVAEILKAYQLGNNPTI